MATLVVLSSIAWIADAQAASTITFASNADAYVQSGGPTSNYGTATVLRVRAPSPAYRTYLRFDVSGLSAPASNARLRLNVTDASRDGGAVYAVSTNWAEATITWNTAPPLPATAIAPIGAASLGWIEIDLGATVTGNGSYAFAIATTSTDSLYTSSREGANPPQLILDVGPTPTPTPTPPGPTPTPPPGPTPTPTPPPATRAFTPIADAQVRQTSPATNYGTIATVRLRAGPTDAYRTYLTFTVAGVVDPIVRVRLRLFVTDPSPDAGQLFVVSSTWTETGITWANAPLLPAQPAVASPGSALIGTWVEWDVGSIVTSNGTYSFALANSSTNSLYASSREGTSPPQLVVATTATPSPAVPDFAVNVTSGYRPLSVLFTDRSDSAATWAWDFQNDGTTDSTAQNPMFTYSEAGTYSVRLTVSNAAGGSSVVRSNLITVIDPPPPGPVTGILVGAGDIADCTVDTDQATATLLDGIAGTVFTAGDNAYESGTATEFANCYNPTWGRHLSRTLPAPGNHEYLTPGASGYFGYYGGAAGDPTRGYYSTEVGGWHVVILNSNCTSIAGGCGAGGAQEQWLRADLAASSASCTIAIWHEALFSSGVHGATTAMQPMWQALYEAGADLVISGHDHDYERFAPQNALGTADPAYGIREFVVGTGGHALRAFATVAPNSEVRDASNFGLMKLTLHAASYDWEFVPVAGSSFSDTGSTPCHGRPAAASVATPSVGARPNGLVERHGADATADLRPRVRT